MKNTIMKNLTFTILTLLLFYSFANAAIVYKNLSPDKVIDNNFYYVDIDNDGTNDIVISNGSSHSSGLAYSEITMNHSDIEIVGTPIPNRTYDGGAYVINLDDIIYSNATYLSTSSITNDNAAISFKNDGSTDYTPWIGQLNKYVGFRIKNTSTKQYHYGWIELSFSSNYVLTVHSYAYEDLANTPIKAGDDGSGSSSNNAPTNITLDNNTINENEDKGFVIGSLNTTDQDANDHHSYTLVSGQGDDDNNSFTLYDFALLSNEVFDYETKSSYSIRVKTDDGNGGTFEKQLSININDVNDAPTFVVLVNSDWEMDNSIDEGKAIGSTVAYIGVSDDDEDDVHTLSLVEGEGSDDNDQFTIEDYTLKSNAIFDYESKSTYSIRVKADDGNGGTYEQQLDVNINDVNNASSDLITKQAIQVFPNPASSTLHIQGVRPNSTIQLISPIGTVVYEEQNKSSNTIVNITELTTGVYWLSVSDSNNTITTRMITIE